VGSPPAWRQVWCREGCRILAREALGLVPRGVGRAGVLRTELGLGRYRFAVVALAGSAWYARPAGQGQAQRLSSAVGGCGTGKNFLGVERSSLQPPRR